VSSELGSVSFSLSSTQIIWKLLPIPRSAKALSFPDQIEIDYYPVDEFGKWAGPGIYTKGPFTWEEVKLRFGLGETYAAECEGFSGKEPARSFKDQRTWKGIGSNPVIRAMTSHQFQNLSSPVLPQWRKARPKDDHLPPAWPSHQRRRRHGLHRWLWWDWRT
jgi:hypothetical protein